jgi:hypothetical protein
VVPQSLRYLIAFSGPPATANDLERWLALDPAPKSEFDEADPAATLGIPILVEFCCIQIECSPDLEMPAELREAIEPLLPGVVPRWIASRRSPRRLWKLAERLSATTFLAMFPALQTDSPREAVARLSEPERELIRAILENHNDREGLAELGFTPRT